MYTIHSLLLGITFFAAATHAIATEKSNDRRSLTDSYDFEKMDPITLDIDDDAHKEYKRRLEAEEEKAKIRERNREKLDALKGMGRSRNLGEDYGGLAKRNKPLGEIPDSYRLSEDDLDDSYDILESRKMERREELLKKRNAPPQGEAADVIPEGRVAERKKYFEELEKQAR